MPAVQSTADIREILPPQDTQWLRALKAEVQPTTFKQGREVAESRRVFGLNREGDRISAQVAGSSGERYQTALHLGNGRATSTCTCPSWNVEGPHCKHVVAAALIYAARFRPPGPPAPRPAEPVAAAPEPKEAVVDDEPHVEPVPSSGDPVSLPALAKVESWLGLSSQPDYEFFYRLTAASTGNGSTRQWIIDVRRQDAQTKGPIHVKRLLQTGAASPRGRARLHAVVSPRAPL